MILNNKGSLAHGHFFLLVIDRAVLVAEAELVTMTFEEDIRTEVIGYHSVVKPMEFGVLHTDIGLYTGIEFFTFAKKVTC